MSLRGELQELMREGKKVRIHVEGIKHSVKGVIKEVGEDYVKVNDAIVSIKAITLIKPVKELPTYEMNDFLTQARKNEVRPDS